MSVVLHCGGDGRPRIRIEHGKPDELVIILDYLPTMSSLRYCTRMSISTKDLVMAIKQVEEERDAKYASDGLDSKGPRLRVDERGLEEAVYRGIEELRTMCGDFWPDFTHRPEFGETVWNIRAARSPEEVVLILKRFEEKYLRPDRLPKWSF